MGKDMATIKYENIIASISVKGQIDLVELSQSLPGSQYNPDIFPGMMYHQKSPKSVLFLFKSGKLLVTGPNSYDNIEEAIEVFLAKAKRSGYILTKATKLTTKNIAASLDLKKEMDLKALASRLGSKANYSPEKFPAMVYKIDRKKMVLVFPNGKIISTGTKSSNETKEIFEAIIRKV